MAWTPAARLIASPRLLRDEAASRLHRVLPSSVGLLVVLFIAASAQADNQPRPIPDKLKEEIEETSQMLDQAQKAMSRLGEAAGEADLDKNARKRVKDEMKDAKENLQDAREDIEDAKKEAYEEGDFAEARDELRDASDSLGQAYNHMAWAADTIGVSQDSILRDPTPPAGEGEDGGPANDGSADGAPTTPPEKPYGLPGAPPVGPIDKVASEGGPSGGMEPMPLTGNSPPAIPASPWGGAAGGPVGTDGLPGSARRPGAASAADAGGGFPGDGAGFAEWGGPGQAPPAQAPGGYSIGRHGGSNPLGRRRDEGGPIPGDGPGRGGPDALIQRSWDLAMSGDYKAAESQAREAIARDPRDARAHEALAYSLLRQRRWREAADAAGTAMRLNPKSAMGARLQAFALQMLGDREGMRAAIEKAALLDPRYEREAAMARAGFDIYDPDLGDEYYLGGASVWLPAGVRRWAAASWPLAALCGAAFLALASLKRRRARQAKVPEGTWAPGSVVAGRFQVVGVSAGPLDSSPGGVLADAVETALGRPVVLRRLAAPAASGRAALLERAKAACALGHPSVLAVYDVIEDGAGVVVVLEPAAGRVLSELMRERGHMPLREALGILRPVCDALQHAHDRGVIHGALTASSILVDEQGSVKVAGFGWGDAGPRGGLTAEAADVRSVGIVLYEMLTGLAARSVGGAAAENSPAGGSPGAPLPGLPRGAEELVRAAFEKRSVGSPAEFLSRLESAAAAVPRGA